MPLGGLSLEIRDTATRWLHVFAMSITPFRTGRTPDYLAAQPEPFVESGPVLINGTCGALGSIPAARSTP
jgi:hypothetical protein